MKKNFLILSLAIPVALNLSSCSNTKVNTSIETSNIKSSNTTILKDYDDIHTLAGSTNYFNNKGDILFDGRFTSAYPFNNKDYALVESFDKKSVIDKEGNLIFPFGKYDTAIILNNGFINVSNANKSNGIIDNKDTVIVPIKYDKITQTNNDNFIGETSNGKMCLYNSKGYLIIPEKYSYINEISKDRFSFKDTNGRFGLINSNGEIIIDSIYDEILKESEGFICVKKDNKYGYINKDGQELIPFQYDDANPFYDSYARVKKDTKYGIINTQNEIITPFKYDEIYAFQSNYKDFLISDHSKGSNNLLIENKTCAQVFLNDIGVAYNNGKEFLINKEGKRISNKYTKISIEAGIFIGDKSKSSDKKSKFVLLDFNGNEISKEYGFITAQPYGFLTVKENFEDKISTLLLNNGEIIFEGKDMEIYSDSISSKLLPIIFKDTAVIINSEGDLILEFKNDPTKGSVKSITILEPNLFKIVYSDNTVYLIDKKNTIIKKLY